MKKPTPGHSTPAGKRLDAAIHRIGAVIKELHPQYTEDELFNVAYDLAWPIEDATDVRCAEAVHLMAHHFPGFEKAIAAVYEHALLQDSLGAPCCCFDDEQAS